MSRASVGRSDDLHFNRELSLIELAELNTTFEGPRLDAFSNFRPCRSGLLLGFILSIHQQLDTSCTTVRLALPSLK